jgi:hypothetical protein
MRRFLICIYNWPIQMTGKKTRNPYLIFYLNAKYASVIIVFMCTTATCYCLTLNSRTISSRECGFLDTPKTRGVAAVPYMGRPHPFPISGNNPTPELTSQKNWIFKKFTLFGHDDALVAVWLMVNNYPQPDERTTKYGPRGCNMTHHILPSRARNDSKRKGDIHIDMFSKIKKRPTNV